MDRVQLIDFTIRFVVILGNILTYALIIRIIISWFRMGKMTPPGQITRFFYEVTQPVLNLARVLPHKIGMIDFSPLIALIGIDLLSTLIIYLLSLIPL